MHETHRQSFARSVRHRSRLAALVALLAAGLVTSACSTSADPAPGGEEGPSEDQTLIFGLSDEPLDIIAGADQGAAGYVADSLVLRGLLSYDESGQPVPALAESFEQIDASTYEFTLREGLTFQDGTSLTSENVKNSLLWLADPAHSARTVAGMRYISDIEVVDDLTVVVHLSEPNESFLGFLADPTAAIYPDSSLQEGATSWVGAGPFKLVDRVDGVSMTLEKWDGYFAADDVSLETIEIVYYKDSAARTNALISGDVDLIDFVGWEDFDRIKAEDGLVLDAVPGLFMTIDFNVTSGPLADERVRQAIAYAINRDNVVSASFLGNGQPLYGPVIPEDSRFASEENSHLWTYDPEKAKELLAEAGYEDGFSIRLLTSAQYAFHQDMAVSVQADLAAVGIEVTLDSPDWATRRQQRIDCEYDLSTGGFGAPIVDPSYLESHLTGSPQQISCGFDPSEIVSKLAEGRTAATEEEQESAFSEGIQLMGEQVPFVPVATRDQAFAYTDRLEGFKNLNGFLTFYSGYSLADAHLKG